MFCPRCGAQLPDNAVFCGSCGTQVQQQQQQPQRVRPQATLAAAPAGNRATSAAKSGKPTIVVAIVAVIAVALLAVVLVRSFACSSESAEFTGSGGPAALGGGSGAVASNSPISIYELVKADGSTARQLLSELSDLEVTGSTCFSNSADLLENHSGVVWKGNTIEDTINQVDQDQWWLFVKTDYGMRLSKDDIADSTSGRVAEIHFWADNEDLTASELANLVSTIAPADQCVIRKTSSDSFEGVSKGGECAVKISATNEMLGYYTGYGENNYRWKVVITVAPLSGSTGADYATEFDKYYDADLSKYDDSYKL